MTARARRQLGVRLVVVGDDEVDAELARPERRLGAADAAVHRDDERDAFGVQPLDRRRLQAVAVAHPFGNEVHDVAAEQLERAAQDDGGRDAVDVVVAVDGDALLARDGGQDAIDRDLHVGQRHRVVQVLERGVEEPRRALGIVEPALAQQARHDGRDADGRSQPRRRALVAALRLPARGNGAHPSSTKSMPEPAHVPELLVAPLQPRARVERPDFAQHLPQHAVDQLSRGVRIGVRAADGFRDDAIDDPGLEQIGRGQLQAPRPRPSSCWRRATGSPRTPRAG